jgi:predicted ArsR family transcriptional regulator
VVGVVENLPDFKSQKRRVQELAGVPVDSPHAARQILRRFCYRDGHGREAWKLRWNTDEPGRKCTWAHDPDGLVSGKGDCTPTLYELERVVEVPNVMLCEGERDADTVNDWFAELGLTDYVATTTPNGAGDVKRDYLVPLIGKAQVYLSGDNDKAGRGYVQKSGELLNGHVADLRHLVVPDGFKDWNERRESGATAQDFRQLLDTAQLYRVGPPPDLNSGAFAPVTAPQLLDEPESLQPAWVWEDYLPEGALAALVAKPKVGKTTNAYELTVKVAQGLPYLGRATRRGTVLILALEEHEREVKRRLRDLGADQIEEIHVNVGPIADSPDTFHQIKEYIAAHGIILVIFDTLNTFWSVQDENNATDVTRAIKPLLNLARESGAAILLLHHARKSEGEFGDEIRGSGALFSLLDVALILKRHEVETQRKLTAISRYPETPRELIIELRKHGHEALGDPAAVGKAAKTAKVRSVLTDLPTSAPEIGKRAGVSRGAAYTILDQLVAKGQAQRTGTGKRGNPYLYGNCVSGSPLRGGGPNETNSSPRPNDNEAAPPEGFVSFTPLIPRGEPKQNETKEDGIVSFGGDGGQTKHNEVEGEGSLEGYEGYPEREGLLVEEVVNDDN